MGSFLHLACEGVRHPRPLVVLRLVVPDLLLVTAVDLGNDELDVLRDEFAFLKRTSVSVCSREARTDLPRHWLTLLGAGPDLRIEI